MPPITRQLVELVNKLGTSVEVSDLGRLLVEASSADGSPLASEATLQLVLTALQSGSEFEARLVQDSDVPPVTWLEVRTWNTESGTWNPPAYYPPGSNTPGTPTGSVTYINNTSILSAIASNTANLDTALSSLFGTLGQKASAGSAPVVLSTEQEAILNVISDALSDPDGGGIFSIVATEATLLAIRALLTTIDADTSNLDVALSTRASEATLTGVATDLGLIYTNLQLNTILAAQMEANIDADTWDTTIGNTKTFSYYAGTEAGHPATSTTEVKTIEFRKDAGATLVFTQTFTYDAANNVLTIVVT